jgi:hypothetical protein
MADAWRSEQFVQGQDMRQSQVADVDIVPNSSSVRRGEIVPVDRHFRSLAERHFYSDFDKVSRGDARRTRSPLGVRSSDIEIPQRAVIERVATGHILQHAFRHQFRPPVRGRRLWRGILGHRR